MLFKSCTLGVRKGIQPVKTAWWGAGVVVCLERGANLHIAHLMPLPLTVACFSIIQVGFTFLASAHPGPLNGCMCVCYRPESLVAISRGMQAVKLCCQQNPPVLDCRCRLTHVDLYNARSIARWRRLWLPHTELFLCDFNVLASFNVFIFFDFD